MYLMNQVENYFTFHPQQIRMMFELKELLFVM